MKILNVATEEARLCVVSRESLTRLQDVRDKLSVEDLQARRHTYDSCPYFFQVVTKVNCARLVILAYN